MATLAVSLQDRHHVLVEGNLGLRCSTETADHQQNTGQQTNVHWCSFPNYTEHAKKSIKKIPKVYKITGR